MLLNSNNWLSPTIMADFYKFCHRELYPDKTEEVYSIFTPRNNKYASFTKEVIVYGVQYFIKNYLMEVYKKHFFDLPKEDAINAYVRFVKYTLMEDTVYTKHLENLHDLGYLPLEIKAIAEGTKVPFGTPLVSVRNTKKEFFWLTNFLETLLSNTLWQMMTSATISYTYKKILTSYSMLTNGNTEGIEFQIHDFSMRGMSSFETSMLSGSAHLTSFVGTDTASAISFHEQFYGANIEKELVGTSIAATEHSVMCSHTLCDSDRDEYNAFKELITVKKPKGFISIVSDSYDFWKVVNETLPSLKQEILDRDGRVVIRPDSGDPVKILCGTILPEERNDKLRKYTSEEKGLIECLWDTFGGTVNEKGYKVLNPKIGAIYGDSITFERCEQILNLLERKGFSSSNVVFGVGSYSFQYNTRDTFGFAMKATAVVINNQPHFLAKDPKTDPLKKSHRGRIYVKQTNNGIEVIDGFLKDEDIPNDNLLQTVFLNGKITKEFTLAEIRANVNENLIA